MNKEQGISHMERVRLKSTTTKISKKQEAHTSAPQNTPALTLAQHILHLQRTVGNRAVGRLMQAKLAVSHPGDPYEREADRVAEQVTSMPSPASTPTARRQMMPEEENDTQPLPTKPLASSMTPLAQRQAMPEEKKKAEPPVQKKPLAESITPFAQPQMIPDEEKKAAQPMQMKSTLQRAAGEENVDADVDIQQQLGQSSGTGSPLPESVRCSMEPRFGTDFSSVRVHTGSDSTHLNRALSAQAFTVGQGIAPVRLESALNFLSVGNRAVGHMLARQEPSGPSAASMPDSGIDWVGLFKDEWPSIIRLGAEGVRAFPGVGILGGLASDAIGAIQDLSAIPTTDLGAAGMMGLLITCRSAANMLNNAFGAVLMDVTVAEDLVAAITAACTALGIPAVVVTGPLEAIVAAGAGLAAGEKVLADAGMGLIDSGVAVTAWMGLYYGAEKDKEAWQGIIDNYQANILGDAVGGVLDGISALTGNLSQTSILNQWILAVRGAYPAAAAWTPRILTWLQGLWNIWGGKGTASPVPQPDEGLSPTGPGPSVSPPGSSGQLSRAAGGASDFPWSAAVAELTLAKSCYELGDEVLTVGTEEFAALVGRVTEMATELNEGRDPLDTILQSSRELLDRLSLQLEDLQGLEGLATAAVENADAARGPLADATAMADALRVPDIEVPTDTVVGEGVVAGAIEAVLGAGSELANNTLEELLAQLRDLVDPMREGLLTAFAEFQGALDGFTEFVTVLQAGVRAQVAFVEQAITNMEATFADAESLPELLERIANDALELAGLEGEFSFAEITAAWHALGPQIDEALEYAQAHSAAAPPE